MHLMALRGAHVCKRGCRVASSAQREREERIMTYEPTPEAAVETDIGRLRLSWTRRAHVHVGPAEQRVTYRGKPYHVSLHLYLIDGEWQEDPARSYGVGPVTRNYGDPAPKTFAAAVVATCREAVAAYLADHPDVPRRAELAHLHNLAGRFNEQLDQHLSAIDDLRKAIAEVDRRIAEVL